MKTYADFDFYINNYHGSLIKDEDTFIYNAIQATRYIDSVTFNRIGDNITDDVRCACCAACEVYFAASVSPKVASGVTSEKVGDYSVSYGAAESINSRTKKLRNTVKMWLADTGLMFRGC